MNKLNFGMRACALFVLWAATTMTVPAQTFKSLDSFDSADAAFPWATLVQGTDGNFYGTASYGGTHPNFGTVFKITPKGKFTTLHNFDSADGSYPYAGLVQATSGSFYGATFAGGSSTACKYGCGTVFSLSVGLGPFVETLPTSGKAGAAVRILGTESDRRDQRHIQRDRSEVYGRVEIGDQDRRAVRGDHRHRRSQDNPRTQEQRGVQGNEVTL